MHNWGFELVSHTRAYTLWGRQAQSIQCIQHMTQPARPSTLSHPARGLGLHRDCDDIISCISIAHEWHCIDMTHPPLRSTVYQHSTRHTGLTHTLGSLLYASFSVAFSVSCLWKTYSLGRCLSFSSPAHLDTTRFTCWSFVVKKCDTIDICVMYAYVYILYLLCYIYCTIVFLCVLFLFPIISLGTAMRLQLSLMCNDLQHLVLWPWAWHIPVLFYCMGTVMIKSHLAM